MSFLGKKICYLDCFSGVSGNMLLGGLLNAGLALEALREALGLLRLPGWELSSTPVMQSGLQATLAQVQTEENRAHRHFSDIRALLEQSELDQAVIDQSLAVFTRLAEAEAHVHGTTPEKIHFHEVGALDAIIDIVGTVAGLHLLGIEEIICSPLPMPTGGWLHCQHGALPLPAPAVCELLKGVPVFGESLQQELVTPTGAALAAELSSTFGTLPPMTLKLSGYGAGTMQRQDGRPNLLRLLIGQSHSAAEAQQVEVIETHLDDWNPEVWPHVAAKLMREGALDISLVPIQMKKGRPGFLLRLLADPAHAAHLRNSVLNETSAIGLRFHTVQRITLPRTNIELTTPWGTVRAKKVTTTAGVRITPEYEDCTRLAEAHNIPLLKIYAAVAELSGTVSVHSHEPPRHDIPK
ncbi:MAG: nickel pincer cofactor biosynthesis protein LarC [Candidatus Electrothrix sp. GW3-4]|uniref:nickel pincer cofactor biosynthesis protein LarC n=1 Tax=Candidatus Electrothrix sp. GW3-4 TaxID=3126740 RepID=UPI0030D20923